MRTPRQGGPEQRHHETWIGGVQENVTLVLAQRRRDRHLVGGVDTDRGEARIARTGRRSLRLRFVIVGDDHCVEERTPRGNAGDRAADTASTDKQDSHERAPSVAMSRAGRAGRPASKGVAGSNLSAEAASRRRAAIPDNASSTTRLASSAVMSAWS